MLVIPGLAGVMFYCLRIIDRSTVRVDSLCGVGLLRGCEEVRRGANPNDIMVSSLIQI